MVHLQGIETLFTGGNGNLIQRANVNDDDGECIYSDVVIKQCPKKVFEKTPEGYVELVDNKQAKNESFVSRYVKKHNTCPNVLKIHDIFEDEEHIFFVMPYYNGRDLFQLLKDSPTPFRLSCSLTRQYTKQIVTGVISLHRMGLAHRDISIENIFYDEKNDQMIIADYGTCYQIPDDNNQHCDDILIDKYKYGRESYLPPEMFSSQVQQCNPFKCDVWAIGIVTLTMVTGRMLFDFDYESRSTCNARMEYMRKYSLRKLIRELGHTNIDEDIMRFLEKCLVIDPSKRANISTLLVHDWSS